MKRTNVFRVIINKEQKTILAELSDRCAALWNAVQYRCRQAFFKGQSVPSYAKLCAEFKKHPAYKALPSDIGQEIIKKARKAWNSFFACLRLYQDGRLENTPQIPGYWKDRKTGKRQAGVIPVKAPRSYSVDARSVSVTLPRDMRKGSGDRLTLLTKGILRFTGDSKTLELKYDRVLRRWYAHQVVEVPEPKRKPTQEKYAALDLGARVLTALAVEGLPQQLLFSGREVWKDFLYWTKRISEEQSRLNRAGRKTSRFLQLLYRTRARRLKHALTALAATLVRVLKRYKVTALFMENLTGIRKDMDFGPGNILVHNFWAFRMLRKLIEAACARAGIRVVQKEPKGTSSFCATCGSPVDRITRHKAYCNKCNHTWHADVNAALYMLKLWGSSKGHGVEAKTPAPVALRWNRHRWVPRAKSAAGTLYAASSDLAV